MIVERIRHSGAYQISALLKGFLFTRTYYGYTRKESIEQFRYDKKEESKKYL